jgi:hypothetical protein
VMLWTCGSAGVSRDMVAWVHQSLASEREFLVHLLGEEPPAGGEPGLSQVPTVEELLDRISESICKPLKVPPFDLIMCTQSRLVALHLWSDRQDWWGVWSNDTDHLARQSFGNTAAAGLP